MAAVCAACGGASTPRTGSSSATASPGPSRGYAHGEVVAVTGDRVTVTDRSGADSSFVIAPGAAVQKQLAASISEVTVGGCALAIGPRVGDDLVSASEVIVTDHRANNRCRRGAGGGMGHVGVAGGEVTAVDGSTYTVTGVTTPQRFTVTPTTPTVRLIPATAADITVGVCTTARGTGDAAGNVIAKDITVFTAPIGGCFGTASG
jgi:hypothetical protein